MNTTQFMNQVANAERNHRLMESMLLEQLEIVEECLDAAERMRDLVPKGQAELDPIEAEVRANLNDPAKKQAAQHKLRAIIKQRRKFDAQLRDTERALKNSWRSTRHKIHQYLSQKKLLDDSMTARIDAEARAADAEAQGDGQTLMGQLGMALFAWKASNAFDDLAKLSGRKK